MNLPVFSGTFFSSFFTDQNLTPILNKNQLRSCDEIPCDEGLLSEPTTGSYLIQPLGVQFVNRIMEFPIKYG